MELRLLSAVCTAIYIYSNAAMAVSFMPLGDLGKGYFHSEAHGVSADGSVVVGYSGFYHNEEAFRWTSEDGMVGLGDLAGGDFVSYANDVSADGSVVVGNGSSAFCGIGGNRHTARGNTQQGCWVNECYTRHESQHNGGRISEGVATSEKYTRGNR